MAKPEAADECNGSRRPEENCRCHYDRQKSIEYIDAIIKKLDIKDFILLERKFLEYKKEQKEKLVKEYEAERVAKYQGYFKAELKEREEFLSIKEKIEKSVRD